LNIQFHHIVQSTAATPNKTRILIVPGNPGVIDFYKPFMNRLFENLNGAYTITGVSHTGHCGHHANVYEKKERKKEKRKKEREWRKVTISLPSQSVMEEYFH
jgi:hypothetical protein